MGEVLPIPRVGDVFADVRGGNRTMRVSYHSDKQAVVVSLWVGAMCRGTFRMAASDLSSLMATLSEMKLSLDPAPEGVDPGAEATVVAHATAHGPALDETGDITGAVNRSRPTSTPALGVA